MARADGPASDDAPTAVPEEPVRGDWADVLSRLELAAADIDLDARRAEFTRKLNWCLEHRVPRGTSNRKIVEALVGPLQAQIGLTHFSNMAAGKTDNPSLELVQAMTALFRLDPGYFVLWDRPAAEDLESQMILLDAMAEVDIVDFIADITQLTPEGRLELAKSIKGLAEKPGMAKPEPKRRGRPRRPPPSAENDAS